MVRPTNLQSTNIPVIPVFNSLVTRSLTACDCTQRVFGLKHHENTLLGVKRFIKAPTMARCLWKYPLLKSSQSIYYNSRCGSAINGPRALIRIPASRFREIQQQHSIPAAREIALVRPYTVKARGYSGLSQALESPAEDGTDGLSSKIQTFVGRGPYDWGALPEKMPDGPVEQYDQWVINGRLKDDEHQRGGCL